MGGTKYGGMELRPAETIRRCPDPTAHGVVAIRSRLGSREFALMGEFRVPR